MEKGNKVKCKDNTGATELKLGKEYEISVVNEGSGNLELVGLNGCLFRQDRFEFINYMMVWNPQFKEKDAVKANVLVQLKDVDKCTDKGCIVELKKGGNPYFQNCKSIEQWRKDNALFTNSIHEHFLDGDLYCRVNLLNYKLEKKSTVCDITDFSTWLNYSEIMTEESALKYIEDNKPKYRPFTQEEFKKHRNKWLKHVQGSSAEYRITKTESDYVYVSGSRCTYQDMLDSYVFEDGSPCGMKEL